MTPLPFVFPYAASFWVAYFWAFWPEMRILRRSSAGASRQDSPDAGSLQFILWVTGFALIASFPIAFWRQTQLPPGSQPAVFWVGLLMLVGGSLLRRHCWRMLGKQFTGDVKATATQQIIERGAYGWVRHPSYTGAILMFSGIGLALGSWASFSILLASSIVVYSYRIVVEERALLAALGEPYRAYMHRHKRLIPFLY